MKEYIDQDDRSVAMKFTIVETTKFSVTTSCESNIILSALVLDIKI